MPWNTVAAFVLVIRGHVHHLTFDGRKCCCLKQVPYVRVSREKLRCQSHDLLNIRNHAKIFLRCGKCFKRIFKAGFSTDQAIYAQAFDIYFDTLAQLESRLASDGRPFLTGGKFTETDLRLFPTLYRHDSVYYVRMKLNAARIVNYPYLWRWLCRVYAMWGVAQSNSLDHCKQGYFGRSWNNVIPIGPRYPMSYLEAYKHPELIEQRFVDD